MATRNTNTVLTDQNGNNRTATHLSANIIIKAGDYIVGAIQEMSVNENRDVKMINEVGTDGSIDSAPTKSAEYSGSCNRVRYDRMRIAEAFNRSFVHVGSQRIPFDIEVHDIFADSDENNAVITVYKNVWITEISFSYNANDWIITDKMNWKCETAFSIIAGKSVVSAVANGQSGNLILNSFEQAADRGEFRGAIDAAGLLNAFINDPTS